VANGSRPAVQVHMGEEHLLARQRDVVGDADVANVPTGRVDRICSIDS
jgi:hypothetical protein